MPKKTGELSDPNLIATVGERFKRARKAVGITHQWLEDQTGVKRTSIGRFETGKRGMESAALVAVLCAAAQRGVDLSFVFTGRRDAALQALQNALQTFTDPALLAALREFAAARGRDAV